MSRIIVNGNQYDRFNIGKLSRSGQNTQSSSSVQILNSSKTNNTTNVTTNVEGHYIFGNYYDATQDIEGSLSNVQDINMSGDLNMTLGSTIMQWQEDEYSYIGPDTYAYLGYIKTPSITADLVNAILADIDSIESDNITNSNKITTKDLEASNKITTKDLEATNKIVSPYAEIDDLYSENIRTKNLTVTGTAHFFELVIDKIKATGGATLLTPADGFKIEYIYNPAPAVRMLYFLAEDDGKQIYNMWEVGDYAIIQNFNKATTGTSYEVDNTYYWGEVVGVSTQPGSRLGVEDDGRLYHYITISAETGRYDGSTSGIAVGNEVVMLGNKTKPERQTAIYNAAYTPPTGAYDIDLIAPFIIYYEGINPSGDNGFNLSAYKRQWWASGLTSHGQQNNIPQNQMIGSFLLSAGKTIQDYIDENIKDAGISIAQLHGGSDLWMINTQSNYSLSTNQRSQTWNTYVEITINGNSSMFVDPTTYIPEAFLLETGIDPSTSNPYVTETALNLGTDYNFAAHEYNFASHTFIIGYDIFLDLYGLTTNGHVLNTWTGNDSTNRTIRFKFQYYKDDTYTTSATINYDIQLNKLAKGANGSAATIDQDEYFLCPVKENCYVDKYGKMLLDAEYTLKHISTDNQGHTVINTQESLSTVNYTTEYADNVGLSTGSLTKDNTNDNYNILISNYLNDVPYQQLSNKPLYITIDLKDGQTVIDKRTIFVTFLTGSVFEVKDDAINMAVQTSNSYTDGEISGVQGEIVGVQNSISQVNIKANGIQTSVNSLTTRVNGMQGEITTKADKSYVDQTATSITSTVTSQISGVQGEIASLGNNVAQNYVLTSSIAQTAEDIKLTVEQDINGQLSETGIDIENKKITLNADNTNINGNLNINDPEVGLILYDVYDNPRIVIQNNELGDFEDFDFGADKRVSGSGFIRDNLLSKTISINNISLGNFTNGQSIRLHNWKIGGSFTSGPQTNIDSINYTFNIKKGSATIHTLTGTLNSSAISGFTYNVPEYTFLATTGSYDYYIDATLTYNLRNINEGAEFNGYTTLYVESKQSQLNKIALDGAVFASDNEHYNWFGSDKTILRDGVSEVRLEDGNILRNTRNLTNNDPQYNTHFCDISSTVPVRVSSELTTTMTKNDCMLLLSGGASGRRYVYLPEPYQCEGKLYIIKNMINTDCRVSCVNESECMVSATSNDISEYEQIRDDTATFISCRGLWIRTTMKQD